jgi:hypothetical protein
VDSIVDLRGEALDELEAALQERGMAQEQFEGAIGTSSEVHAYERLRRATRGLAQADRNARRSRQSVAPETSAPSMIA